MFSKTARAALIDKPVMDDLTPRTQISPDLAKDDLYGRDQKLCDSIETGLVAARRDWQAAVAHHKSKVLITDSYDHKIPIHAPKPRRKQCIAADFEKIVERFQDYDPTAFADDRADNGASRTIPRQQDNYQPERQLPRPLQNAPRGLQPNYTQPPFASGYPSPYQQGWIGQQPAPYPQRQPQPPPGYERYQGTQQMYTPEYHTQYQQQPMPRRIASYFWQPVPY